MEVPTLGAAVAAGEAPVAAAERVVLAAVQLGAALTLTETLVLLTPVAVLVEPVAVQADKKRALLAVAVLSLLDIEILPRGTHGTFCKT